MKLLLFEKLQLIWTSIKLPIIWPSLDKVFAKRFLLSTYKATVPSEDNWRQRVSEIHFKSQQIL